MAMTTATAMSGVAVPGAISGSWVGRSRKTSTAVVGLMNLGICHRNWTRNVILCRAQSGSLGESAVGKVRGVERWRSAIESLRDVERMSMVNYLEELSLETMEEKLEVLTSAIIAGALVLFFALSGPCRAAEVGDFTPYYGTAASASSYGGYGGNTNKRDSAEYTFEFPTGWKERTISKIEKGTNGTDSEFLNPKHKEEKVYVTYLAGFRRLAPREIVLDNLALSDPVLQDILSLAEGIKAENRTDSNGQLYYDYEIDSPVAHALISVTCTKNKLYAHFVKAGNSDWNRDQQLLRHVHESFQTIGASPLAPPGEF